jgi:Leucine-rich repeat (LRR) protein
MPFLEVLSLAKNRITVLPPELAHHTHIRTLRLSQNRITQV